MSKLTLQLMAKRNDKPTMLELEGQPLRPCPFCAGTEANFDSEKPFLWLECSTCGARAPVRENRRHAIKAWQRRDGASL